MATAVKKQTNTQDREIQLFAEKIVINVGLGRASQQPNFEEKVLKQVMGDIAAISGQQPQIRQAAKSIAGFKIRQGQTIGARATLRGTRMVDFFKRLVTIVMPRVRDFAGIALNSVDEGGNLNIGFKEQYVFSEIVPERSPVTFSFQVTVVPKTKDREAALEAYRRLGVPLKKSEEPSRKK